MEIHGDRPTPVKTRRRPRLESAKTSTTATSGACCSWRDGRRAEEPLNHHQQTVRRSTLIHFKGKTQPTPGPTNRWPPSHRATASRTSRPGWSPPSRPPASTASPSAELVGGAARSRGAQSSARKDRPSPQSCSKEETKRKRGRTAAATNSLPYEGRRPNRWNWRLGSCSKM